MASDTLTQRWWRETDPCQQPLPDAAAKGKMWSDAEEVFIWIDDPIIYTCLNI